MKDYRTIPVEALRDFARTQTEVTSIRRVADDLGIGRSTLHKFILGRTMPLPRVRRLLGLWYLKQINAAHDIDVVRPFVGAMEMLLSGLPEMQRQATAEKVTANLVCGWSDAGKPPPRWLELLNDDIADGWKE